MSRFRVVVFAPLTGLSAATPAAAQSVARGGAQLLSESMLNRYGLTRAWWSHATINSKRDKLAYVVVDETHLFLQSTSGVVSAFDTDTGRYLWTKQIGASDRAIYPATSNDDLLFVINGLQLYAVNKNDGNVAWRLGMPGMAGTSPAADNHKIYVGFLDGSLYTFDLKTTQQLFSQGKLPQFSESCVVWRYRTSKPISIPAIPGENVVAFASRNGSLYSVTKEERKLVFQFETDAPLSAPISQYHDNLLLASQDFNFYSLNMRTGKLGWQYTAGVVIRKAPILIGDEVYLFPDHGNMVKLSAETGVPYWSVPRMVDFLAVSTSRVYVVDKHNNLVLLLRDYGQPLGMFPLDRYTIHVANDRTNRIYIATEAGLVMCLREQGSEFASFHVHPDRRPILPEFAPEGAADAGDEPTEMEAEGEKPDGDMPAEVGDKPDEEMPADEKPEADNPDEEMPAEKPEADEGDEKPEDEKPDAEKSDEEMPADGDEKPAADEPPDAEEPADEKPGKK